MLDYILIISFLVKIKEWLFKPKQICGPTITCNGGNSSSNGGNSGSGGAAGTVTFNKFEDEKIFDKFFKETRNSK